MNINSRDTYYNSIYIATIVNSKTSDDPNNEGRVQIYIPSIHYRLQEVYKQYINLSDKAGSKYSDQFPWATTLVDDLKDGDIVYGSYVNNMNDIFIILGKDTASSNKVGMGVGGEDLCSNANILALAMPIILENEISLPRKDWPDNISDERYAKITPNDNFRGWSIGLIQWHATRAYDLLVDIARDHSDWKSCFSNQSLEMCQHIQQTLNGTTTNRNKYDEPWVLNNTTVKECVKNMLLKGKDTQKKKAEGDTQEAITKLQNEFKITNPALIIFGADIMNQYGKYVDNSKDYPYLKGCFSSWMKKCNDDTSLDTLGQLTKFLNDYWYPAIPKNIKNYSSRRDNTYNYIKDLDKQGKLSDAGDIPPKVVGFVKRTTAPTRSDYWFREDIGNKGYSMWSNNGNCTFYAWGRASEILGRKYDGATGNGVDYGKQDGKYQTGSKPKQGAIITWSKGNQAGHVAIVEDVSEDGNTIWTSESGWQSFMFKYRERKNDGNWGAGSSYKFQNFKYII